MATGVSGELFSMVCSERDSALYEVAKLEDRLREALELYASAECVGPTRQERARVDEMRKAVGLCALDDYKVDS